MIIELLNGNKLDISKFSLHRLYHHIPSLSIEHTTEQVDDRDGMLFLNSRFSERVITVEFLYKSYDINDYYLLRDEINALFTRKESFYIIFKNEPYKRYLVKLNRSFEVTPNQYMNSFEVEFTCVNIFGESVMSTSEIKKEWDRNQFAWNGQITWDEDLQYRFESNDFIVKNLGNVDIDPRQNQLDIVLRGTFNSSVIIMNETTGDMYTFNRSMNENDVLILSGVSTQFNGTSAFKHTNKKLITLRTGDNKFSIRNGTVSSIAFGFRFLYL